MNDDHCIYHDTDTVLMMSMTVECYVCVDGMIKTYVFFRLT